MAGDLRLDLAPRLQHLTVHDADEIEGLQAAPLRAPDGDEEVLHHPEAGVGPADLARAVQRGEGADQAGQAEHAPDERVAPHAAYCILRPNRRRPGRARGELALVHKVLDKVA